MHPLIRILCLLALALGLAQAAPTALLLASLPLAVLVGAMERGAGLLVALLRRLRWLLVSVMLAYAWLVPGDPLLPAAGSWSPTLQGLVSGACRAWMLLVMAVAARLLVTSTPREELVAGLHDLLAPLRVLRVDTSRFCLRLVLTLEYALESPARKPAGAVGEGGFIARATALAGRRFEEAVERAERQPAVTVDIPELAAPAPWQWLVPVLILAVLLFASGAF